MADEPRAEPAAQLIAKARDGDERAFAELVTPYRSPLFALLLRELRDRSDAEDVMQDVLFLAWRGLSRYEHRGRFGAWLFTIAYRAVSTCRRAPGLEFSDVERAPPVHALTASPQAELEAAELNDTMLAAIAALPERQRHVLLLRQTSELTFAEIAELLQQPLNTVLSHMHYATQKLRRAMKDHV